MAAETLRNVSDSGGASLVLFLRGKRKMSCEHFFSGSGSFLLAVVQVVP